MATSNVFLTLSEKMFEGKEKDNKPNYGTAADNKPGAIEVLNFSFAINQVTAKDEDGRQGFVERIARGEVEIKKAADARSPKLFIFCCKAEMIEKAELLVYGPRWDRPYLSYTMYGVRISKYEPSGGEDLVTEKIGLRFGQMKVKFDNAGIGTTRNGNDRYGTVEYTWNWTMDVPGFTPVPTGYT